MKILWRYLKGTVIRPFKTFERLQDDPQRISKSFQAILLIGILYTLTVVMLAAGGALISAPAFLALSPENYYFWEMFFALPVVVLGWILAAGFAHLLSRGGKGRGTFEGTLAVLGFAVAVPQSVTWLTETAFAILLLLGMKQEEFMELSAQPGFWQTFVIAYQAIAVTWMLFLVILGLRASQRLKWRRAILFGLLTTVLFMAVMIIFIR